MKEDINLFKYNPSYPSVSDLKKKAKQRMPKFAFDYLEGGCNDEVNLQRNERDFQSVQLLRSILKSILE